ncbi:DEAD/DEAH box helicase family protein [Thomasclavelia cocleata]|uniref:restriction endonuclease n=1 Tax=Thomasclavelia cocleata TaxID=69824 RepID=UPI00258C2CED|nr:DEAD/DEAH box helicase family protein [Thomasclavelia cocleata]
MKLKYIDQLYQTEAVNAICDIFEGCEVKDSLFTIDATNDKFYNREFLSGKGVSYFLGHSNRISIDDYQMLENVQKIQEKNDIQRSKDIQGRNFTVEMETGTGKTYVYTKTILELNKKYGFTKFIVVVPSIAIKEGVFSSFQATEEHFKEKYDNVVYNYFVYDSGHLEKIRDFATSTNIEIMIINIDAFRKSFTNPEKETKANLIHRESDRLSGNKPIDLIASTNPIVIIDEPQSVDNTKKSKEAIASLNPICTLRYSATHKQLYNLMYRLTPVDAYQENLVKHIEVASITSNEASTEPYIKLKSVSNKNNTYSAKVEIYVKNKKTGVIEKKTVTVKTNDDLWELSNEVDYYQGDGYIIDNIDCFEGEESISLSNGESLNIGESMGKIDDQIIKRAQIRQTIELHLNKELHYIKKGIKVLSLFFIDEVAKYRNYDREDEKGDYAIWFEEEYNRLIKLPKYKVLREKYSDKISLNAEEVHDGYFSKDGKGRMKNSNASASSKDDESTFHLIMKNKEQLLSFDEPIRFIFSHSALKEGWDNPNVFQVCTLIETKDTMTKRQKVGRGLRICVDQDGNRVLDNRYNTLSVIANESYKDFASTLQKELETDNFKFGIIEPISFAGICVTQYDGSVKELTQEDSQKIFDYLLKNEYMTKQGKINNKYHLEKQNGNFILPDEFESFTSKVIKRIDNLSREIDIKNLNEKIPVKINKEIQLFPEFEELWNKIKQKTIYTINMDIDKLKNEAIEQIKNMPQIKPDRIDSQLTKVDINKQGVQDIGHQVRELGKVYEFGKMTYPDFIRRLQDSTQLLRKTIIEVIAKSGRLKDFYKNPEEFIKQVSKILLTVKKENLTEGIKYQKIDEYYQQDFIFNDEELYGYRNKNLLELTAKKNVFDHVIYDSEIEKTFAIDAENDDDVILYAKLPSTFKIDTPIGGYNPDWVIVLNTDDGEKLYFVAETKGTENINDLKGSEKKKILCGRKHFEVVDSGIRYEIVKELKALKL